MSRPKPAQKRNVIVIGKTGTGKSTVANKITGSDKNFKVSSTPLKSLSSRITHCEITIDDPESNVRYDIKVIDTIGLFDNSRYCKISNKEIMDKIKKYLNEAMPEGITLVIFVFKKGRYTQEEEDTFNYITENFKNDVSEMSALVITNCENDDDEGRRAIIEDFKDNARKTAMFMEKGIYAVGFPDLQTVKPKLRAVFEEDMNKDIEELRDLVKRTSEMRLAKRLFEQTFWEKLSDCTIL